MHRECSEKMTGAGNRSVRRGTSLPALALYALALAVTAAAAACHIFLIAENHDAAGLLLGARLLMEGAAYNRDFFDFTPPLIFLMDMPLILAADFLGVRAYSVYVCAVSAAVFLSAAVSGRVFARAFRGGEIRASFVVLSMVFVFTWLPGYDFSQRDHLAVILMTPAILLWAVDNKKAEGPGRGREWAAGAAAALGALLKPHFLCVYAFIIVYRIAREKSASCLADVKMIALYAVGLCYTALMVLVFPGWFGVLQTALMTYGAYDGVLFGAHNAVVFVPMAFAVLIPVLPFSGTGKRLRRLLIVMALALLGFVAAYALQKKGWTYHLIPANSVAGIMLFATAAGVIGKGAAEPRRAVCLALALAGLAASIPLYDGAYAWMTVRSKKKFEEGQLVSIGRALAAGKTVMPVSTDVYPLIPMISAIDARMANGTGIRWLVPGILKLYRGGEADREKARKLHMFELALMASELKSRKPDVVIIDERPAKQAVEGSFDFNSFYMANPDYAAEIQNYRAAAVFGGFRFLVRTRP